MLALTIINTLILVLLVVKVNHVETRIDEVDFTMNAIKKVFTAVYARKVGKG
jgi:hypothetical protein